MKLTYFLCLVPLALVGCATADFYEPPAKTHTELVAPPPATSVATIDAHPATDAIPDALREKMVSAYANTYWMQIFPVLKDCWALPVTGEYSAEFHKNGQTLSLDLPREDTRWKRMVVTFDSAGKLKWFSPRRE